MALQSKKASLVILGATALICSRVLFFFFNDPEGPNLLIVAGLAVVLFLLSFAVYTFSPSRMTGFTRVAAAICIQILAVIVLYFCMR